MENVDMFNNATAQITFHNFLDRMRHPSAADLVRSIKNFIGTFLSSPPDPEKDSQSVQEFMANTENAFRAHPLWAGVTEEELESSGEGLEKYLMTKLWPRAFSPLPEDAEIDEQLSEKMTILQEFIRPEHLDIPKNSQNETSWLLAQKELQRINTYRSPRDKLVCILYCCRVINNLLVKVSMASNESPPGADDFLPVLIYVVIKANPPQLHSNLQYIQRYRHQGRLVSEAAYFFTNLVSAESFIKNLDSTSLSLDPAEFEKRMQAGRVALQQANVVSTSSFGSDRDVSAVEGSPQKRTKSPIKGPTMTSEEQINTKITTAEAEIASGALLTADKLEAGAMAQVLEADKSRQLNKDYPFLYSSAGDLRVMDVEALLYEYKELVLRYVALRKAVEGSVIAEKPSTAKQKPDTEIQEGIPLERGEPGTSERTQSVSQLPINSDFRVETSAGELLDPNTKPEVRQALPEGNASPPHVDSTKLEDVSPDKQPMSISLADAEVVSDILDTSDLGSLGVAEEHMGVEMGNLGDAEESKDTPSDLTTAPHEDSTKTPLRSEEQSSPS